MGTPERRGPGHGRYLIIAPGTRPLGCADIAIGDKVEINGRDIYRSGTVAVKGDNLHPEDGAYFPCMIGATGIDVGVGDSGGAVLVRGIPAGVASRSFGGALGFTPLAEGLSQLGLELCTDPDCGLVAPVLAPESPASRAGQREATNRYPRPRTVSIDEARSPSFRRSEPTTTSMTLLPPV